MPWAHEEAKYGSCGFPCCGWQLDMWHLLQRLFQILSAFLEEMQSHSGIKGRRGLHPWREQAVPAEHLQCAHGGRPFPVLICLWGRNRRHFPGSAAAVQEKRAPSQEARIGKIHFCLLCLFRGLFLHPPRCLIFLALPTYFFTLWSPVFSPSMKLIWASVHAKSRRYHELKSLFMSPLEWFLFMGKTKAKRSAVLAFWPTIRDVPWGKKQILSFIPPRRHN